MKPNKLIFYSLVYKKAPFGAFFVLIIYNADFNIYIYLFCNIFMIGISIITQFITYPSFQVNRSGNLFSNFHKAYTQKNAIYRWSNNDN